MIRYDGATKTFFLSGKTVSYCMRIDGEGYLEHLSFGGRVAADDLSYLTEPCFLSFSPKPAEALDPAFSLDTLPQEFASYGSGDFRSPTALFRRADGETANRFRYLCHTVTAGKGPEGLPHARGGETLSVTLADGGLQVVLAYTVFEDSDVIVRHIVYRNAGEEPVVLERAYSFSLDLPGGEWEALHFHGRHLAERIPERLPLKHGLFRISSARGASSHQENPFFALCGRDCGEDRGECYGFGLVYSGSFALEAERGQTDLVRVQGGINDLNFSWELAAGEEFSAPQAFLCYSENGLGGMSRALHTFFREHLIPAPYAPRPVLVNNWEATYFDFNREKLLALIDEAASLGMDTFVLDDGWFGKRDDDTSGLGDWFVNEKKLEGGLAPLAERCKQHGMRFGLWFEPEMISEDSDLFRAHPDWAVGLPPRCTSRNQYVLDFSRPEVVAYVASRMTDLIGSCGISYVKWDMNRHMTEFYSAGLPATRQGEFSHRYMLGVYSLAERLKTAFPHVFFEGCSGGGGRFDAGMLSYFPQIWTSDDTDAYERAKIQWGTSYAYPMSAMSCHVSACPNHQTGRTTPFSSRGLIASLGATGYELDLGKLTEEEKSAVRKQIADYRRVEELILRGDLYRLLDPFAGNFFAEEVVSSDQTRAYIVGMTVHAVPADFNRRLRLKGLDEKRRYHVEELGLVLHGSTLMRAGLLLPKQRDFETWVWHLEPAD